MKTRAAFLSLLLAGALSLPAFAAALSAAPQPSQDNSAPVAQNLTLKTYRDVAISSRFAAVDPDGDPVTFQITDSPARGEVTVDDTDPAAFWYTPYEGKKGKDSFTYVAVDDRGNTSQPARVDIVIEKQATRVSYSDLEGSAAHYAALRLAESGLYVGRQVAGQYCFDPELTFTREEFLAMAMAVVGADPLEGVTITGFYDDQDISAWAKGYVSAGLMSGAVRGSYNDQRQVIFNAGDPITAAEAAVFVDRLLDLGDVAAQATAVAVPAWASQSAANLETASILPAGADLTAPLTRAQAAQMLCAMQDVVLSREEDKGWFW